MDTVQVTPLGRTAVSSTNVDALVAISKGMQAVKLLHHNPPHLNWGCLLAHVVLYNGHKMVVAVVIIVIISVTCLISYG